MCWNGGYILLIGIDIIDIDRVRDAIQRTPRFLTRVYTAAEREYCMSKKNPYPSLAVRFAAKEAVRKLHPALAKCKWQEIEIKINADGSPALCLHGQALQAQMDAGLGSPRISLSHSAQQAVAAVIATKG
jgi:holo-[acyl-carrier protein] synthase